MAANRNTAETVGAARDGSALLSGLLHCVLCGGHRMTVRYHGRAHSYVCAYELVNYGIGSNCQHIAGPALDRYLTGQVLAAVAPAALQVSLHAAEHAQAERATLDTLWRQRLERGEYAADRARRQYQLAEPENRLVARQLEKDWESTLSELDKLRADYQRFTDTHPVTLSTAQRERIRALAHDLPAVWSAASTTITERKELLRTLIDKITVAVVGRSELVEVTICWAGGHKTTGQAVRPVARLDQLSYYPRLRQRVTELSEQGRTTRQIAEQLNAEGLRPPKRTNRFGPDQVRDLLHHNGIGSQPGKGKPTVLSDLGPNEWSVSDLAATLEMPSATLYNWIYRGWVSARHAPDGLFWIITADTAEITRLRDLHNRPPGYYTRQRWTPPADPPTPEKGTHP
jgi:hypothetical protein